MNQNGHVCGRLHFRSDPSRLITVASCAWFCPRHALSGYLSSLPTPCPVWLSHGSLPTPCPVRLSQFSAGSRLTVTQQGVQHAACARRDKEERHRPLPAERVDDERHRHGDQLSGGAQRERAEHRTAQVARVLRVTVEAETRDHPVGEDGRVRR